MIQVSNYMRRTSELAKQCRQSIMTIKQSVMYYEPTTNIPSISLNDHIAVTELDPFSNQCLGLSTLKYR